MGPIAANDVQVWAPRLHLDGKKLSIHANAVSDKPAKSGAHACRNLERIAILFSRFFKLLHQLPLRLLLANQCSRCIGNIVMPSTPHWVAVKELYLKYYTILVKPWLNHTNYFLHAHYGNPKP